MSGFFVLSRQARHLRGLPHRPPQFPSTSPQSHRQSHYLRSDEPIAAAASRAPGLAAVSSHETGGFDPYASMASWIKEHGLEAWIGASRWSARRPRRPGTRKDGEAREKAGGIELTRSDEPDGFWSFPFSIHPDGDCCVMMRTAVTVSTPDPVCRYGSARKRLLAASGKWVAPVPAAGGSCRNASVVYRSKAHSCVRFP